MNMQVKDGEKVRWYQHTQNNASLRWLFKGKHILLMLTATYLDSVMKKNVVDSSPNNITDIQFVAILHCSAHTPIPRNEQYTHIKSGSGLRRGGLSYVY